MNKSVAAKRNKLSKRQQHETTSAMVELKNWYKMNDSHGRKRVEKPYLMSIRDKIETLRIEREEILAERMAQDAASVAATAEVEILILHR